MRDPNKRKARDHERYLEKRDEILAYPKRYREEHKDEIRERRRKRNFEKFYANPDRKYCKTRQEMNRSYYLRHRDEILAKQQRNYERKRE